MRLLTDVHFDPFKVFLYLKHVAFKNLVFPFYFKFALFFLKTVMALVYLDLLHF